MPQEPFSAEQVIDICRAMRDTPAFQNWERTTKNRHALRWREIPIEIPGISVKLEDRTGYVLQGHINRYNNLIDNATIIIEVSARESKQVEAAQRVERFFYALYHSFKDNVWPDRRSIDMQVAYGCGIDQIDLAPEHRELILERLRAGADLPTEGIIGNPFILRSPQLSAVAWEPNFKMVSELGTKTLSKILVVDRDQLNDRYRNEDWLTSDTMTEFETVWDELANVWHLETEQYIYDVVEPADGVRPFRLEVRPNIAGRPWYTFAPGSLNSEVSPEEQFEPLIGPIYPVVEKLGILQTLVNSGALQTGRNMFQEVAISAQAAASDFNALMDQPGLERPRIGFGFADKDLPKPRDGFRWEPVAVPDQAQLMRAVELAREEIAEFGFPRGLSPSAEVPLKASSGYQSAQGRDLGGIYLTPALKMRAFAWKKKFQLIADIVKELGVPISIPAHKQGVDKRVREMVTVSPDDFKEYDVVVSLEAKSETGEFAQREADAQDLERSLISLDTVMARRYPDWVAEKERIKSNKDEQRVDASVERMIDRALAMTEEADFDQALADAAFPVTQPEVQQVGNGTQPAGGPAPGETIRQNRPAGGPVPGLGSPVVPPVQTQPGQGAPPSGNIEGTAR